MIIDTLGGDSAAFDGLQGNLIKKFLGEQNVFDKLVLFYFEYQIFSDTLETALDTVNLTDPFWTDPSQWTAGAIESKLCKLFYYVYIIYH